jgi:dnd system-associated protein 4
MARFSPPKDKIELIKSLTDKDSPFNEYRDILFLAAVIGWRSGRRLELSARGEAIRWDVMVNRYGTEAITDMIAVASYPDDPSILAEHRQEDRIAILEEYANGGLDVLQDRLRGAGAVPTDVVLVSWIQEALNGSRDEESSISLVDQVLNL